MALPEPLASLPLAIDDVDFVLIGEGQIRQTAVVHLTGDGAEGLGEDISPIDVEDFGPFIPPPELPLRGRWTLGELCSRFDEWPVWPEPPDWDAMRLYRRYAFESAALDLALRQARTNLADALGRTPEPVRFVHSRGLGDPPALAPIQDRLVAYPGLRFKLDVVAGWTDDLITEVAATNSVDILDFKGQYGIEVDDEDRLVAVYERAIAQFPDALIEDPHDLRAVAEVVAPHAHRVSYDAPIHAIADIAARPHTPRTINVKPSRVGSLATLFAIYEHCDRNGIRMYGGGMGEMGVGRGQAQLLASLFHADTPNDLAPSAYNQDDVIAGLAVSPLEPENPTGFRW